MATGQLLTRTSFTADGGGDGCGETAMVKQKKPLKLQGISESDNYDAASSEDGQLSTTMGP